MEEYEETEKKKIDKIIKNRKYFPYCDNLNGYIWISIIIFLTIVLYCLNINIIFALIFSITIALIVYLNLPIRGDLNIGGSIEGSLISGYFIIFISIFLILTLLIIYYKMIFKKNVYKYTI